MQIQPGIQPPSKPQTTRLRMDVTTQIMRSSFIYFAYYIYQPESVPHL